MKQSQKYEHLHLCGSPSLVRFMCIWPLFNPTIEEVTFRLNWPFFVAPSHRDAHASRTYSKTNMACCVLWCLQDDIFEQYLERQLTLKQRQMADLYSHEQYFRSVKIYKDVTVFDIEARCFGSQLKKRRTPSRVPFFHEGDFGCVINSQAHSKLH